MAHNMHNFVGVSGAHPSVPWLSRQPGGMEAVCDAGYLLVWSAATGCAGPRQQQRADRSINLHLPQVVLAGTGAPSAYPFDNGSM